MMPTINLGLFQIKDDQRACDRRHCWHCIDLQGADFIFDGPIDPEVGNAKYWRMQESIWRQEEYEHEVKFDRGLAASRPHP